VAGKKLQATSPPRLTANENHTKWIRKIIVNARSKRNVVSLLENETIPAMAQPFKINAAKMTLIK
jgi:hypothetical protein